MRFLVKARPSLERTNQSIQDGTFGQKMQRIMSELKPEAAYFTEEDGHRTAIMIVDIQQASDIPKVGEPFFHMGAEVFFHPVMSAQDLASSNLEELGKKWGSAT